MRRKLLILPILLLIASCTWIQPPINQDPVEAGIRMTIWQMELQAEYNARMAAATDEQAERLRTRVAPLLDRAKYELSHYNDAVLTGQRPIYHEYEIREKLREAEQEMEAIDGT